MNLIIRSHRLDLYEITNMDHQYAYVVDVVNESGQKIDSKVAYGLTDRTMVTRSMIAKHGSEYIVKIEHND